MPWAERREPRFCIFTGGRSADDRVNMKILWSAPPSLGAASLVVHGVRVGHPDRFVQTLDLGPSILNVPLPGCWRLTLEAGSVATRLTVLAVDV